MVLAIDVGNTNITVGVFNCKNDKMEASFRITTKMPRTSDEYAMILTTLLIKYNNTMFYLWKKTKYQ